MVDQRTLATKKKRRWNTEMWYGYGFIFPTMTAFLVFSLIPTIGVIVLSFFNWNMINKPTFLGLDNYMFMFSNSEFWHSLWVTLKYVLYSQVSKIIFALIIALALNQKVPGSKLFRIPIIMPWIVMPIAVGIVWKWILSPSTGLLNYYLVKIGVPTITWFSPDNVLQSIALVDVWQYFGFTTVLFLIGLQGISPMYYEAANIDGANGWRSFFHITLPLLRPTFLFIFVTAVIGSFQVFDIVYATTQGGPGALSKVYYYMIYEKGFQQLQMGYASALSVFLFGVLFITTLLQMHFFKDNQ
ncbi:sugar ABC transporter permease [Paenibacillus frigoriresistens]|uniref:carbohydrate ABC transporter permease n=1 Tax=Paenibacillus alginolyticus TaxID=59839 RepID=UPI0015641B6B|nr:sugar ABC transporter permease [Paenibacillus frigoriresistens]NRF90374.1 sugar ABC transporter permease [Paenibacillus frigoriresistens]